MKHESMIYKVHIPGPQHIIDRMHDDITDSTELIRARQRRDSLANHVPCPKVNFAYLDIQYSPDCHTLRKRLGFWVGAISLNINTRIDKHKVVCAVLLVVPHRETRKFL
jgi:hypothetical protein